MTDLTKAAETGEPKKRVIYMIEAGDWRPPIYLMEYAGESYQETASKVLMIAKREGYHGTIEDRLKRLGWRIVPGVFTERIDRAEEGKGHQCTPFPVRPECSREVLDEGDLSFNNAEETEITCEVCGTDYTVRRNVSVSYSTWTKKEVQP